jgi:tRNA (guanine26-N2/guanine27-N2)-dimethyltransferase
LRTEYCHELAVRLLAGSLATAAAKHDIGITIAFSHSSNHYVRVYAKIQYGAKKADESINKMGYILHCYGCLHRETRKKASADTDLGKCVECGSRLSFAGPLWLGEIADERFVGCMEEEASKHALKFGHKITRMLALVKKESNAPISYYSIDRLCSKLRLPVPSVKLVIDSLEKQGFAAFPTHFDSNAVKSEVPAMEIRSILQSLAGQNRQILNNISS